MLTKLYVHSTTVKLYHEVLTIPKLWKLRYFFGTSSRITSESNGSRNWENKCLKCFLSTLTNTQCDNSSTWWNWNSKIWYKATSYANRISQSISWTIYFIFPYSLIFVYNEVCFSMWLLWTRKFEHSAEHGSMKIGSSFFQLKQTCTK